MARKSKQPREKLSSTVNKQDIDYVEVSLPTENLDQAVERYASFQIKEKFFDELEDALAERQASFERKQEFLRLIYETAADVLTEAQFKIFTLRYVFNLKETDIATQVKRKQSYIAIVLRECAKKIKKNLKKDLKL